MAASRQQISRRTALQLGTAGLLGVAWQPPEAAAARPAGDLTIAGIDRVTVKNPYREVPGRNMARELPHWEYTEILTAQLKNGVKGFGETLLFYTWGATSDRAVQRAIGGNAAELMWDDTLGAGLQMALFDAVARAAEVPIHRLLGRQLYDRTPLSWWNIDTSPEDMASECRLAHRQGYLAYKTKGRPWFDLWKQMETATAVVPPHFKIDMDYNSTLLNADKAIPILQEIEQYPQADIYETPIPQSDIPGNRAIRQATRVNIAMHYGQPRPLEAIRQGVCDGFVIGGGASRVMRQGHVAAMADLPFWLQLVGTGITAAFSLHFGAVLSHARWPAVNCHQLYRHSLLTRPIELREGYARVPTRPGLGYEIDWNAVENHRVEKPSARPEPPRLIEVTWANGRRLFVANSGRVNFMIHAAMAGQISFFERGVRARLIPDDGSARWRERYQKARKKPLQE